MPDVSPPQPPDIASKGDAPVPVYGQASGWTLSRLRHEFRLSRDDWQSWLGVLHDAPLPPHPALPVMLRHLGYLTSRLDRSAHA